MTFLHRIAAKVFSAENYNRTDRTLEEDKNKCGSNKFFSNFFFLLKTKLYIFFSILFFQLTCSMEFSIFFINVARSFGSAIYGAKLFIFCSSLHFKSTKYFFLILCVVFFLVLLVSVIMSSTNRFRAYFYPIEIFSI